MKKLTRLIAVLLALTLLAAACGDDSGATTDPGDTIPSNTHPSDTLPPETLPPGTLPPDTLPPGDILGAGPYPIADLTISVTLTDGGVTSTYRISCLGDTATLTGDPAPATADRMCLALNADPVEERLVAGDPGGACTLQYGGPETATVTGTFDGAEVDTAFHRTDGCGIGDWTLLDVVLPAPA